MKAYEHLHVDLSPAAVAFVGEAIEHCLDLNPNVGDSVVAELRNLANECRARVQHAAAGMPDISEPEDWLAA